MAFSYHIIYIIIIFRQLFKKTMFLNHFFDQVFKCFINTSINIVRINSDLELIYENYHISKKYYKNL